MSGSQVGPPTSTLFTCSAALSHQNAASVTLLQSLTPRVRPTPNFIENDKRQAGLSRDSSHLPRTCAKYLARGDLNSNLAGHNRLATRKDTNYVCVCVVVCFFVCVLGEEFLSRIPINVSKLHL